MTWHADAALLDRYARGALGDVDAASVEAHVTGCDACRRLAVPHADPRALERIKLSLDDRLDEPRLGWLPRALERIGVTDRDARLVAGSLALEASWCAASLVAVSFALLAANVGPSRTSLTLFLIVAPLAPLAGVALAFGRRIDPTFEIAQASPIPSIRVLLIRALAILGLTIPVLLMLSVPFGRVLAFGWLLPALALAAGALAAGTFVPLTAAAAGLAGLWVVGAVFSLSEAHRRTADAFAGRFVMLQWQGQLLCAVVAVVSLAVLAARRHSYEVVS